MGPNKKCKKKRKCKHKPCSTYHIEISPKVKSQDDIVLSPVCERNSLIPFTPRIHLTTLTESDYKFLRGRNVVRNLFSNTEHTSTATIPKGISELTTLTDSSEFSRKNNVARNLLSNTSSSTVIVSTVKSDFDIKNCSTDSFREFFNSDEDFSSDDSLRDKNYVPDSDFASIHSDENNDLALHENEPQISENLYENSNTIDSEIDVRNTEIDEVPHSSINDNETNIQRYLKNINDDGISIQKNITVKPCIGKRSDKKQSCLYCKKLVIKLPRHLLAKHSNELKVIEFSKCAVNSKERKKIIEEIRNLGNFVHNTNTIAGKNDGELIVKRRPSKKEEKYSLYLPCQYCYASISKKLLSKHIKICKSAKLVEKPKWKRIQSMSSMMLPLLTDASISLRENVLNIMRVDTISDVAKNDKLILLFGSNLCTKYAGEKHLNTFISCKMRELSRLLIELRRQEPKLKNLADLLQPKYIPLLISCVKNISGYDNNSGRFKIPSLAKKLGHSLKMCINIWLSECIKLELNEKLKLVENFLRIFDMEWHTNISRAAVNTLYEGTWNKIDDVLPLSEDIQKINRYVNDQFSILKNNLKTFDLPSWKNLMQIVLCNLILFNRRRAGEVEKMTIKNFNLRSAIRQDSEVYKLLTVLEKNISGRFKHVEIRGKKGRKVPLLISLEIEEVLELLLKHRLKAGVSPTNPFVFGKLESSYFRGVDAMRSVAKESGAKVPQNITSTKLRKHIATSCQLLNLRDNELDYIANYMGHDIRIHRQYYRLPDNAIHLGKISKLLLSMENGTNYENQGKSLDQLHDIDIPMAVEKYDEAVLDENIGRNNTTIKNVPSYRASGSIKMMNMGSNINENQDKIIDQLPDIELPMNVDEYNGVAVNGNPELPICNNTTTTQNVRPKSKVIRRYWSTLETNAVQRHLNHYIEMNEVPGMVACMTCKEAEPDLESRSWIQIKSWVCNKIKQKINKY